MDLVELGSVLGEFFDNGSGPSHNELDAAFTYTKTTTFDPAPRGAGPGGPVGKTKRIRQALMFATDGDPSAGFQLAVQVVSLLRADGTFVAEKSNADNLARIDRLGAALMRLGHTLHPDGTISAIVIDNLTGTKLTDALQAHVRRLNANPQDAALQIGGGKELDETAARHVLNELLGSYPVGGQAGSFPVTLAGAFTAVGFAIAPPVKFDSDPHRGVQQALFLLGLQVNRLRNEVGTGHGRPDKSSKTPDLTPPEARLVARATALVAGALLDKL
ncbi:hypothetical protein C3B59_17245 [Cryobacterium zongtaii]|uniref:Abortive infection protein-like C-terminal domain-containing protein n=1 Tax=Cryobacterium zongtaii TaxID=1259217 RepID=A0A2S3Z608_9MICO|nr:abortive infection family protein [Cryobacterium zongtaii]POH59639.1 hypothetical protein C3B59_17245 [Cryobacterium zongtaii]